MPKSQHSLLLRGSIFFVFLSSFFSPTIFSFADGPYFLAGLTVVFALLVGWVFVREKRALSGKDILPLVLFAGIAIASTLFQIRELSIEQVFLLLWVPGVIFLFAYLLPPLLAREDYEWLIQALLVVISVIALLEIYLGLSGAKELFSLPLFFNGFTEEKFYSYGIFPNRNQGAHFAIWAPAAAVYLALTRTKLKSLWWAIALITFARVLSAFSRGALLGMLVCFLSSLLFIYRTKRALFWKVLGTGVVFFLLFTFLQDFGRTKYLHYTLSMGNRESYWKDALTFVFYEKNWIWGSGLWGYWPGADTPKGFLTSTVHNSLLAVLVYFGIPAFLAYLWILKDRLRVIPKSFPENSFFYGALGLFVTAQFSELLIRPFYFPCLIFWLFVGSLCSLRNTYAPTP